MSNRILICLLSAMAMIGAISIDAYLPALPAIAANFSVPLEIAQQSLTIYMIAYAGMTLFFGTLSDTFGRRYVILVSLVVYVLSSAAASFSPTIGWFFFFRLLQGLSAGAGSVIGRAIVGDLYTGVEAQRIMSYVSILFGLAPAIAPIIGGWLQAALGWRSIFLCIALFALALLLACLRWLPETLPPAGRHAFHFRVIVTNYWRVARHARFMVQSLANGLSFIGVMLYVSSAPAFILNILHLSETEFAWLFVPQIAGMMLGSIMAGRLSHLWSSAAIIRLGFSIMALAAAANIFYCCFFTVAVPWAIVPIFFYAGGVAIVNPPMSVETLELFPNVRGLASSLMAFFFMILFSVASGLIAPLIFGHALSLAFGMAAGAALSLFFWTVGKRLSLGEPVRVIPD